MKTLDMTLSDFCKVYDMLLNLQKVEMNVPAVWKALKNSLKTIWNIIGSQPLFFLLENRV